MLLFLFLYKIEWIEITGPKHKERFYADKFEVHWIHSVEKEEWYETYEVRRGKLFLSTSTFKTYGAGVPTDLKYKTTLTDDGFVEVTINEFRNYLYLNVSTTVETEIHYNDCVLKLFELYEDYTPVNIEVVKKPLILYLLSM